MAKPHKFEAKINSIGDFYVGEGKTNEFTISIAYKGNNKIQFDDCTFRLRAGVGDTDKDLVLSEALAKKIETAANKEVTIDCPPPEKNHFVWEIFPEERTSFEKDTPLTVTFSKIESHTEPGTAELIFEAEIGDDEAESQPLSLLKKSGDQPRIIYFYTTTEERLKSRTTPNSIFPAAEQILSGEKVTLHWSVTEDLRPVTLKKGGINIPITEDERKEGKKKVFDITEPTDFVLSGNGAEINANVHVEVIKPGWHDSTTTLGDDRLEPTCLFNADADNQTIFAVFRGKHPETQNTGLLFKTENPFWGWSQMPGKVPEGFVTSPGVYHDNKLWLIGGSQIDPEITSNEVWSIEPSQKSPKWEKLEPPAPWSRRMGHAVLVYQNKIWVMGGCDENGNALNDFSIFDVSTPKWSDPVSASWGQRCMFSAVAFNNRNNRELWLGGGATEPLSGDFCRDLYIYRNNKWEGPYTPGIEPEAGAVSLQVFVDKRGVNQQKKLHLIGSKARTPFPRFFYRLDAPTRPDEWFALRCDQLQGWANTLNVVYQLVNLKDKYLIANALGYREPNDSLKVFVY